MVISNIKIHKIVTKTMEDNLIHRDISWLHFNFRVLQEAMDESVPLYERIKFLAIYSSNMDEFFKVRVAQHRNLLRVGKKTQRVLDYDPRSLIKEILLIVNTQREFFNATFNESIIPQLKKHRIFLKRRLELTKDQIQYVESYFHDNLLPYVQPVLLVGNKIRPFLNDGALYLAVIMAEEGMKKKTDTKNYSYAIVKIPSDHMPRYITLPSDNGEKNIIFLDDIVRHNITYIFPGYDLVDTFSIKLTRDAELYIEDEFSGNLISKIKESLSKRNVGPTSRLVYDKSMPQHLLDFLQSVFEIEASDLMPEGRYHNNHDLFKFPSFNNTQLFYPESIPLPYEPLENAEDIFAEIKERDHVLNFPYQSYQSVVDFFEKAAKDPFVTHIKITQYRVAKRSQVINALLEAAKAGKHVSVFVEVKARFDEEANLKWGEILEKAGIQVQYSFPGLKVHSKIALIRRVIEGKAEMFCYFSTGNFNEETAKIYSDKGLFTSNKFLTTECARLFSFLETVKLPENEFEHLLVGQFNLREQLEQLVNTEMHNAQTGKKAGIILKMNSLQDEKMIELLYAASQAGVKIQLIIRGICCLIPGLPGISENITAISIVDKYLEHSRIFVFENDGDKKVYISSADWMVRNLSYRIETCVPIYDEKIKKEILDIMDIQLHDNVKARIIEQDANNNFLSVNSDIAIRSQHEIYHYLKRKQEF